MQMDKFVGKRLDGRYEIQEVIGVGGMAVVYKARDNVEDRIVAIKILKDEFTSNEEFIRRFKNESKAIAMLSHPNIVKVYDVSFGDLLQYIVMEYIDGITLKEYIERQGSLRWKDAVHFTVQILRGLQHAHDKGIVHRDVKPQNIMVLPDGTIKVTDFGIARFARSEQRTITDKAIGSVHYISPEQARGERTDEKADIYSVGVMLYEMLTGQVPFQAESAVSVAIMQLQRDPKPPTELNPSIPLGLEQITMHAMQKTPERRYQSAAEMLCDLDAFRKDPAKTFEYNYFVDDAPTRYVNPSENVMSATPASQVIIPDDDGDDEQAETKEKSNIVPILAGIAAALVVALVIVGVIILKKANSGTGDTLDCPKFVGMTQEDIKANGEYNDWFDFEYKYEYDDKADKGVVVKQSQTEGKALKKGAAITLTVSLGKQNQTVPNLENSDVSSARQILEDLGLSVTLEYQESTTIAENKVIGTNKEVGVVVAPGEKIILYVSTGAKITAGDYVSQRQDDAQKNVKKQGLNAVVKESDLTGSDKFYPAGYVFKQEPANGTTLAKGDTVTLYVSTGKVNYTFDVAIKNLPKDFKYENATASLWLNGEKIAESNTLSLADKNYSYTFTGIKYMLEGESANQNPEVSGEIQLKGDDGKYYTCMNVTIDISKGKITKYTSDNSYPKADTSDTDKDTDKDTAKNKY